MADAALALALAGASCLIGSVYHPAGWPQFDALAYVLMCLVSAPLAVWRRYPMVAMFASNAGFATYVGLGYQPSVNFWSPVIALFLVAASRRHGPVVVATAVTAATVWYSGIAAHLPGLVAIAQAVLAPAVAVGVGTATRRLGERNALLADLTAKLQAQQQELARRAVMEERVRIARELHDIIAHHMSLISVQAGLARYVLDSDPATASTALATISDTSREALGEMRRLLGLLRFGPEEAGDAEQVGDVAADQPYDPAPGLDRLDALIERVRAAGLPVTVAIEGEPRPLAPGAALCVYRVVQESLTNVLVHAAPTTASVTIAYRADDIIVKITDAGCQAAVRPSPDERRGHGLAGMRERARLYGGTLEAGRRPEGGFSVVLMLPYVTESETEAAADTETAVATGVGAAAAIGTATTD